MKRKYLDQKLLAQNHNRGSQTPGPGSYALAEPPRRAASIAPRRKIHLSTEETPSPAQYSCGRSTLHTYARIGERLRGSIFAAKQTSPGPATYNPERIAERAGKGHRSLSVALPATPSPGPSDYQQNLNTPQLRESKQLCSISSTPRKIRFYEQTTQNPGPAAYDTLRFQHYNESRRYGTSLDIQSDKQNSSNHNPGPYDTRRADLYLLRTSFQPEEQPTPEETDEVRQLQRRTLRIQQMQRIVLRAEKSGSDTQALNVHCYETEDIAPYRIFRTKDASEIHFSMAGGPTFSAPIHGRIIVRDQYPRNRPRIVLCSPGADGLVIKLDDEFLAAWRPICGFSIILDEMLEIPQARIGNIGAKSENVDKNLEFTCSSCGADHSQIKSVCQYYDGWEEHAGSLLGQPKPQSPKAPRENHIQCKQKIAETQSRK